MIKSYTDIEQSKKLADILPLKTADFGWNIFVDGSTRILPIDDWDLTKDGSGNVKFYHAWSLSALLNVLPKTINHETLFIETSPSLWHIGYRNIYTARKGKDNPVDACYELILKLRNLKMM